MSEVAYLFPTHAPNFAHTARLLEGVREHRLSGTWVPLFSTAAEATAFYSAHPVDPDGVHLVIEPLVGADRLADALARRSVVNLKKLAALWDLQHDFATLHVIDTECVVLRHGAAEASASIRRVRRAWPAHGHAHPLIREIQDATVRVFDLRDRRRLREEVLTDRWLYSWFEDVPTYDSDDLAAFFAYFGASSDVTQLTDVLTWETFEHLLFQYFCCLHRGWRLLDTGMPSPQTSVAWWEHWDADRPDHAAQAAVHLAAWAPSWVRDPRMAGLSPNAFLAYHQEDV